jgi:hypothetical protein
MLTLAIIATVLIALGIIANLVKSFDEKDLFVFITSIISGSFMLVTVWILYTHTV